MKLLKENALNRAVERIVEAVDPERVYLYGSHCYGTPNRDSDVDLLVVISEDCGGRKRRRVAVEAYRALSGLEFPAEIKVVTARQFKERSGWLSTIERVVKQKGRLVYDRTGERGERVG